MRKIGIVALVGAFLAGSAVFAFQEAPKPAEPAQGNEWLKQLLGEWTSESEMTMAPGQPPTKTKGTATGRAFGQHWLISEVKGELPGVGAMSGMMTLGYSSEKKKFVGTWVDTMMPHMWIYEGTLDETGKILTLDTEGPDMTMPGKTAKYRDVTEIKSPDQYTLTSSVQGADGKWTSFMTITFDRKK